jgi:hypothetical protein
MLAVLELTSYLYPRIVLLCLCFYLLATTL